MQTLQSWNQRQIRVFRRYSSRYHVPLVPELVLQLAGRFARKHACERSR